ncbi:MAG: PDDEXK nuclease domain-containing protein [Chitinophagaceae bacterium]
MAKPAKVYHQWLQQLKERIRSSQIKAALRVNAELLSLYWDLGKEILNKEKNAGWGTGFLPTLSNDLKAEFPALKGFSLTNLKYIRIWVNFYTPLIGQQVVDQLEENEKRQQPVARFVQQAVGQKKKKYVQQAVTLSGKIVPQVEGQFGQQPVDQIPAVLTTIPWGHHLQIVTKCKDINEALFYISQTTQHNWSRSVLVHQMESGLYKRKGKALTNFEYTLPKPQSDLANELLKNPYHFDFLMLGPDASEKELEDALLTHLTKFLLELGAGFAFLGRQYKMTVEDKDYELDLLFYHIRLHCHIVIELKIDDFKPEYAGKLNFYLAAADAQLKAKEDRPSIGLLLCKKAGKLTVEYSLKDIGKPIGVSEYRLTEKIPASLKGKLPTIKEIERELKDIKEPS